MERFGDLAKARQAHPAFSSVLKYYGAELNKRRHELLMAAGGSDALEWEGARSNDGAAARTWLRTKANSIEGGTQRSAAERDRQTHPRIAGCPSAMSRTQDSMTVSRSRDGRPGDAARQRAGFLAERRRSRNCGSCATRNDAACFTARRCGRDFGRTWATPACWCPRRIGGSGLGMAEAACDGADRPHLGATPFLATACSPRGSAAWRHTRQQQHAWLPRIASGRPVLALAVDEHAPPPRACRTPRRAQWRRLAPAMGRSAFVLDGHVADALIVAAASAPRRTVSRCFSCRRTRQGVTVERTVMVDCSQRARVRCDGVTLGRSAARRARRRRTVLEARSTPARAAAPPSCWASPTRCSSARWST